MSAYLESALSLEEYREAKNKLVNQNQLLKEKLSAFEQKANNRFELTEKFLKCNMELANEGIPEEILRGFKKVGSNFKILDRTVLFKPRGAWRILAESGFCGGNALVSRLWRDPISASKTNFQNWRRGWDSNPRGTFIPNTLARLPAVVFAEAGCRFVFAGLAKTPDAFSTKCGEGGIRTHEGLSSLTP